LLFLII